MLSSDKNDIPALTGLRFIAALSVAVAHGAGITLRFGPEHAYIIDWLGRGTAFGMTLFFVLSGFVIHLNYRTSVTQGGLRGIGAFMWARFVRLYPLFLLLLALDFTFHTLRPGELLQPDAQLRALPYYLLSLQSWVYVPIRDYSLIYAIGLAVPVTWSISTEWFFYLAFPLIAPIILLLRRPSIAIAAAIFWCAIWAAFIVVLFDRMNVIEPWAIEKYGEIASQVTSYQDSYYRWLLYFSPYVRIGEFVLGCIFAQLYLLVEKIPVRKVERISGALFQAVAIATIIIITVVMYMDVVSPLLLIKLRNSFAVAPSVAILIFCMARYRDPLTRFVSARWMTKFGDASYELYLIHIPVFVLVAKLFQPALGDGVGVTGSLIRFSAGMVLLLLASVLLHRSFDVPVRRWLKALWGGQDVKVFNLKGRQLALIVVAIPVVTALAVALYVSTFLPKLAVYGGIGVISASYGKTCGGTAGNATNLLRRVCDGRETCSYNIDSRKLKRLQPGCSPDDLTVAYQCSKNPQALRADIVTGAAGKISASLMCPDTALKLQSGKHEDGVRVLSASYGENCGARRGNVTKDIERVCTGQMSCAYRVDVSKLGDPARGCEKDYRVEYQCGQTGSKMKFAIPGEAGLGSYAILECGLAGPENAR
ncbi:MAG: acyltransferase family protein [Parvibaculum sp.]|nr:acyltransferase family protein [Parvibaculum sp.]